METTDDPVGALDELLSKVKIRYEAPSCCSSPRSSPRCVYKLALVFRLRPYLRSKLSFLFPLF